MPAIHQFVAGFSSGDAISNEARVLRSLFRAWGCESEIFCETKRLLPELRRETRDLTEAPPAIAANDVALLHLSTGSDANDVFKSLRCRKAVQYHNITPPDFFRGLNEEIRSTLARGLEQARGLAGVASVTMAVSRFNAAELEAMGHRDVKIMPLLLDRSHWDGAPDRALLERWRDGAKNILFVGRCAPNKRVEDLLSAFHFFQNYVEPESRLLFAGSWAGLELYRTLLATKAADLRLRNVVFTGAVHAAQLRTLYRASDVFLCMSEHEGFCIPLIEAMASDLPVMAYAAAAVPDTLDGAGVLFREKKFDAIAEMLGRLCRDAALRQSIVTAQRARVDRYFAQDLPALLRMHLSPLLGPP